MPKKVPKHKKYQTQKLSKTNQIQISKSVKNKKKVKKISFNRFISNLEESQLYFHSIKKTFLPFQLKVLEDDLDDHPLRNTDGGGHVRAVRVDGWVVWGGHRVGGGHLGRYNNSSGQDCLPLHQEDVQGKLETAASSARRADDMIGDIKGFSAARCPAFPYVNFVCLYIEFYDHLAMCFINLCA